jgi:hypothetical protein
MTPPASYYESHVTFEPLYGADLTRLEQVARRHSFRVADLVMLRDRTETALRSNKDTFCTARGPDYQELLIRMNDFRDEARSIGVKVWRCKIEAVVYDVRYKA